MNHPARAPHDGIDGKASVASRRHEAYGFRDHADEAAP